MAEDRGVWFLPSPSGEGSLVVNAHPAGQCSGACPLHSPSGHWARDMPLRWEFDPKTGAGRMERLCPHGGWHDDPDDLAFRRDRGMPRRWMDYRVKYCDCPCGCDHEAPF